MSLRGVAGPSSQLPACVRASVRARLCVCVCDTEDSGDSLLKQYNGHLSPRGVIQIQYQAKTFSSPLSAFASQPQHLMLEQEVQRDAHPHSVSVSQSP